MMDAVNYTDANILNSFEIEFVSFEFVSFEIENKSRIQEYGIFGSWRKEQCEHDLFVF